VKQIEVNLNDPFEKTLIAILSLPEGGDVRSAQEETVEQALRCLYTAAHGRAVQTSIGPISIAPATDSSLKDAPLSLHTRSDLLVFAQRRADFKRRATDNGHSIHTDASSALFQFIAGRLGSPECWAPPSASIGRTGPHGQLLSPTITRDGRS